MPCPKCGGEVEIMVDITVLIPDSLENNLTKSAFRQRNVKLYAANWERAAYFCKNDQCRWMNLPKRIQDKIEIQRTGGETGSTGCQGTTGYLDI